MNWISVKDRMPLEGQDVIVCTTDDKAVGFACVMQGWFIDPTSDVLFGPGEISHWVPLPEPPEE